MRRNLKTSIMANYNVKVDLGKLKQVAAVNITGRSGVPTKCVVIPVDANSIFLSDKGGMYLDLQAIALKEERYGQSHLLKRSIPKEEWERLSDEEKKSQPIIGSLIPIRAKEKEVTESAEVYSQEQDDLPF